MLKDSTDGKITAHPKLLLHVDGGCEPKNPGGVATSGWVLFDPKHPTVPLAEQGAVVQDGGPKATNNYGEYKALTLALEWLIEQGWRGELLVRADSKLLIEQVCGRWQVKAEHLKPLRAKIWDQLDRLDLHRITDSDPLPPDGKNGCHLAHVYREYNEYANDLCRAAYQAYKGG